MDLGKIIAKAWEAFWNHKILWLFGILNMAVVGIFGIWFSLQYDYEQLLNISPDEVPFSDQTLSIMRWGTENTALFVIIIILIVLAFLALNLFLTAFTTTGLIKGNLLAHQGTEKLSFGKVASGIGPYFWRVVGLNALLGVSGMGLIMGLFLVLILLGVATAGLGMLCLFPLFCLMIPFSWFLAIVVTQANIAIVADDLSIWGSVVHAWKLVTSQIGPYVLVWLIVIVITMVVNLVISLPSALASLPTYGTMFSSEYFNDPNRLIESYSNQMRWSVIWMPVQYTLMGIFSAFSMSIWVQTYLEFSRNGTLETPEDPQVENPESLEKTI